MLHSAAAAVIGRKSRPHTGPPTAPPLPRPCIDHSPMGRTGTPA